MVILRDRILALQTARNQFSAWRRKLTALQALHFFTGTIARHWGMC
jgi:hypothetical protein